VTGDDTFIDRAASGGMNSLGSDWRACRPQGAPGIEIISPDGARRETHYASNAKDLVALAGWQYANPAEAHAAMRRHAIDRAVAAGLNRGLAPNEEDRAATLAANARRHGRVAENQQGEE
jgi:hypothetical protein